ncbi:glycosyltransferase family 2 protein [Rouxiella badensis]|jgi:glycosyltransferase involved in cell wall biosynthesis|uniref:glycosyltransferase family 2 protein n=1 Tax=Rouxiella badensis TaxID=1646377 RepID=UPI000378E01F|nr:hypothetical protein [Rouxiella badensis]WAT10129.1 family 2 glycosyl transferase [Rouxiella badensis]
MKIGIGVITTGDRLIPEYAMPGNAVFEVFTDADRNGPAYARNRVLKSLYDQDCDYIFLMDDDVTPRREDWAELAITAANKRGLDFIGWPHVFETLPYGYVDGVLFCTGVTVQFSMLTRKCVELVGYFDERYGKYGPEDITYAYRAHRAGLCGRSCGWEVPLSVVAGVHVEDMFSGFRKSVVPDDVKKAGMEAGNKLLEQLVRDGGPVYVGYPE